MTAPADDVRRCHRCRDLIPGGPVGWARHDAGLDSAERLMHDALEEARAEHADATASSPLARVHNARY